MNGGPEFRVLFVCAGNTCRSPLAEGTLRAKVAAAGLDDRVAVDSAGTSPGNPGGPPDPRASEVARAHGVEIDHLRGRAFTRDDFERFDRIVAVDARNRDYLRELAPGAADRVRVRLLRDGERDVADPFFGGIEEYERAYAEVDEACDRLLDELRRELGV